MFINLAAVSSFVVYLYYYYAKYGHSHYICTHNDVIGTLNNRYPCAVWVPINKSDYYVIMFTNVTAMSFIVGILHLMNVRN